MGEKRGKKKKSLKEITIAIFNKTEFLTYAVPYFSAESKYGDFSLKIIVLGKL